MTSLNITRNTGLAAREWSRIRLGCTAASVAMFTAAVVVLGALTPGYNQWSDTVSRLGSPGERWALAARGAAIVLAPCTGLAAAVFRFTWGTPVYGLCERVVLGLGMCWILVLATRALTRPPGHARWRT